MLLHSETKEELNNFFQKIKLKNSDNTSGKNKAAKIEQIFAYLDVINARIRKYSKKRELEFIDSGAGNCYLSFLLYYYYKNIEDRKVKIHCIDINQRLMLKNQQIARDLNFTEMYFHACDISDYNHSGRPDIVYTLHACDFATDKALLLGCKTNARHIFSVSCCQHSIRKQMKRGPITGITKHRIFKEKLVYMLGDSLRSLLLQMQGYEVDIIDFISSRYTDKNIMLRAQKGQVKNMSMLRSEYNLLQKDFGLTPALERYFREEGFIHPHMENDACAND